MEIKLITFNSITKVVSKDPYVVGLTLFDIAEVGHKRDDQQQIYK